MMISVQYVDMEKVKTEFGEIDTIKRRFPARLDVSCIYGLSPFDKDKDRSDVQGQPEVIQLWTSYGLMTVWGVFEEVVEQVSKNDFKDRLIKAHGGDCSDH